MIYLDNSATTPLRKEVIETMNEMMSICYGNPSSLHRLGLETEKRITKARKLIASHLNVNKEEIYFTSGGTESNNIAIQGTVAKNAGKSIHIITTKIEHASVLNVFKEYEKSSNIEVDYVNVDSKGIIDLSELSKLLRDDTLLVSVMMVNNETGIIQPIEKIKETIKSKSDKTLLHVDGVQALGKRKIDLKRLGIDLFSFSGHKIHGPKGIGGLYVKKGLNLKPLFYGGGQEKNLRSGTENTIGIMGMYKALELMEQNYEKESEHIQKLKTVFLEKLACSGEDFKLNSLLTDSFIPNILSLSFENTRGEIILHSLEEKDIYISTTSACSSKDKTKSHVLEAIGLNPNQIEGSIRISFSYQTTTEEVEFTVAELVKAVKEIRSIMKR